MFRRLTYFPGLKVELQLNVPTKNFYFESIQGKETEQVIRGFDVSDKFKSEISDISLSVWGLSLWLNKDYYYYYYYFDL